LSAAVSVVLGAISVEAGAASLRFGDGSFPGAGLVVWSCLLTLLALLELALVFEVDGRVTGFLGGVVGTFSCVLDDEA